jgi:hypothetical protein
MNTVKRVISAREAGRRLGRAPATIEQGLRDGTFPVGTCFKTKSDRFVYIIPEEAFERFMNGEIAGRVKDGERRFT